MKDYYSILELTTSSTESDIRKAYRKLAKKYHPDVNKSVNAPEKFIEISEAYEFLINHYQQNFGNSTQDSAEEYTVTDYRKSEEFLRFKRQAKMRYEEFKKQHEAFQKSGLYDLGLLIKYLFRLLVLLIPLWILYITIHWIKINKAGYYLPFLIIVWIINVFLVRYLIINRKRYLKIGDFYYSFSDVKRVFTEKKPATQKCAYCVNLPADSIPFKLEFLKEKDIKLKTAGFRQHNVSYINEYAKVEVPRSHKAFMIHTIISAIKILSIVLCIIILRFDSKLWRMIAGIVIGGTISQMVLFTTSTRSSVSYLFSYKLLIKAFIWIIIMILASDFQFHPINITSTYIQFAIAGVLFFDCFLEQLLKTIFGKRIIKPLIRQYEKISEKFTDGYQLYNDIPILTVVYPLYKWIFGI